jgi:uncharacterized protein YecE (DUF72 family)
MQMKNRIDNLFVGTCSWKYESWKGLVYSAKPCNFLEEYASRFNSVEIDQWFWSLHGPDHVSLPRAADVVNYASSVPDDFRFTIKAPNSLSLTHFYRKEKNEALEANPYFLSVELFSAFLERIEPILSKTGVIMLQFEYLNRKKMESQQTWFKRVDSFLHDIRSPVPLGIEIRNPAYINASYFQFLADHDLVPVFLEGYYMPSVVSVYHSLKPPVKHHAVIRLHGPDRQHIEQLTGKKWNRIVAPKDEHLQEIARMISDLLGKSLQVYLNINNHYEGSAPLSIEKIQALLDTLPE